MTKTFLTLLAIALIVPASAQFVIAGVVDPLDSDYTITPPVPLYDRFMDYTIDINQDSIDDIRVEHDRLLGSLLIGNHSYERLVPLNGTQIAYNNISHCETIDSFFVYNRSMSRIFGLGDTVDSRNYWVDSITYLRFYEQRPSFGPSNLGFTCAAGPNYGSGTKYVGLRIPGSVDYTYAWLALTLRKFDTILVSAYTHDNGQKVHLEEEPNSQLSVYPNPANHEIFVSGLYLEREPLSLELFDLVGNKLLTIDLRESDTSLDLSLYPEGVYVILISRRGRLLDTHKLVISRSENY